MPYAVILLQENYLFRLGNTGDVLTQPQSQAVNVAPYSSILPFVHVRTSTDNNIPTPAMGVDPAIDISFSWMTAAALPTQFDVKPPGTFGDRFVALSGGKVTINEDFPLSATPKEGKTFTTAQLAGGGLTPITNPGGLLLWRCTNNNKGTGPSTLIFRADIYLVCRGE